MKPRIIISWAVFIVVFWIAVALLVYQIAKLPLWVALLFPLLMFLVGGLLNVVGTLLGRREERAAVGSDVAQG